MRVRSKLTIDIQSGRMLYSARPVHGNTGVLTAILDHYIADVHVTDHIAVYRDVLSHHKSVEYKCREIFQINAR